MSDTPLTDAAISRRTEYAGYGLSRATFDVEYVEVGDCRNIERELREDLAAALAENERLAKAQQKRLADINLAITHLGQIYGLIEEGKFDEASDYCRCAAESWTQDIAELDAALAEQEPT